MNTNEMNQEIELATEEAETVIAPALTANHSETMEVDLSIEELEEVIAPKLNPNHNETFVS